MNLSALLLNQYSLFACDVVRNYGCQRQHCFWCLLSKQSTLLAAVYGIVHPIGSLSTKTLTPNCNWCAERGALAQNKFWGFSTLIIGKRPAW